MRYAESPEHTRTLLQMRGDCGFEILSVHTQYTHNTHTIHTQHTQNKEDSTARGRRPERMKYES